MKKLKIAVIISLCFVILTPSQSHGFVDAVVNGVSNNIKAARDYAYQLFMKAKIIQQIVILKQNYDESKRYYDKMKEIIERPGGIGNYMADSIHERMQDIAYETYYQLDSDFINTDGTDTAVRKWIKQTEKTVETSLSFLQTAIEKKKKRDADLKKAAKRLASTEKKTVDQAKSELELISIEIMGSLEQNMFKTNELLAKMLAQEYRKVKLVNDQETKFAEQIKKIWQKQKGKGGEQRSYEQRVMEELRRKPD